MADDYTKRVRAMQFAFDASEHGDVPIDVMCVAREIYGFLTEAPPAAEPPQVQAAEPPQETLWPSEDFHPNTSSAEWRSRFGVDS
jgi:hypothetical protein